MVFVPVRENIKEIPSSAASLKWMNLREQSFASKGRGETGAITGQSTAVGDEQASAN